MMILDNTMSNFINTLSENSKEIYKIKINSFKDFLTKEKGITDKSYSSYLEGMKIDEIIESLDFYIVHNKIKSESIAFHYTAVIKRYFDYLYSIGIRNENMIRSFGIKSTNKDSYQKKMNTFIYNDVRLEKVEQMSELLDEDFKILVSECDEIISDSLLNGDDLFKYKKHPIKYNDFISSIILKLILFSGATYRTIRELRRSCISKIPCTITINNYTVHLPNNLSKQLLGYIDIRDSISIDSDYLFIDAEGNQLKKQTNIVADTLCSIVGRKDVTGLVKYTIIKMIEKGINQSIIQEFTDVGITVYKSCQGVVNNKKENTSSRYLDSKMRSISIYDDL